ncbi:hypothetical protein BDA99DRAFT_560353 [Phascolomyces articulosus]|uniref:Uncharacterized protein n=1 Tax=Phascolomyces articulosus TaxID=60185 RepID=A0AAD5KC50_9FUNG|nr:hypothetical protein BDA99DRAFT_560353 [Phascolomyces articulosus]
MYITYETAQYSSNDKREFAKRPQPPITIPNDLPKPDFMPSKLVRVSDMKAVDGSQVNEGKRNIISYDDIYPDMIIPRHMTHTKQIEGTLKKSPSELIVSQILYHAHQRTSIKEHDRVFALIQLFPEFIDHTDEPHPFKKLIIRHFCGLFSAKNSINKIRIDYSQPLKNLMIQFYAIEKYKFLPSWTGVNSEHFTIDITTSFRNYDIIGKTIHVTTTYVTLDQSIDNDTLTLRYEDLPPIPDDFNFDHYKHIYDLCILVQLSETEEMRTIKLYGYRINWNGDYRMSKRIGFDYLAEVLDDPSTHVHF